jgi:hypothetical protein
VKDKVLLLFAASNLSNAWSAVHVEQQNTKHEENVKQKSKSSVLLNECVLLLRTAVIYYS